MSDERESLSNAEKQVIIALSEMGKSSPEDIRKNAGFQRIVSVMNAASWLQMKGLVVMEEIITELVTLAKKQLGEKDLPERTALKFMKKMKGVIPMDQFNSSAPIPQNMRGITIGWMRRKGWVEISKDGNDTLLKLTEKGRKALKKKGDDENLLSKLAKEGEVGKSSIDPRTLDLLNRRKDFIVIKEKVERRISLTDKGKEIADLGLKIREQVGQLTPEMLQDGRWGQVELRPYDINSFAPAVHGGKMNPLRRLMETIRDVFLTMGFTEISGDYVESTFWNMDALFIPQDHPARDMQDTFYLKEPSTMNLPADDIVNKVRDIHQTGGGTDSRGWGGEWALEESKKALLRTHTTINTIRYLSKNNVPPIKVFSIEPVFRRETIDKTHLPVFHQVEGIIVEKEASFKMLKGILAEFYKRLGFTEIRFRPAYYPYTEPSMDVECKFKGEWLELGGSGIFRPEVLEPFHVEDPVLAWGLGLERLALLLLSLDDIRQLYISDLDWLKKMPVNL